MTLVTLLYENKVKVIIKNNRPFPLLPKQFKFRCGVTLRPLDFNSRLIEGSVHTDENGPDILKVRNESCVVNVFPNNNAEFGQPRCDPNQK